VEETQQEEGSEEGEDTKHRKRDIGLVAVAVGIAGIIATIFQTDLNHWLKSVWFQLWHR